MPRPWRALFGGKAVVKLDAVFLFDVPADEGRIRHLGAFIVDVGQLAFGRLEKARSVNAVRKASHLQQHFGFGHERTRIRKIKRGAERIQRDHCRSPSHRVLC
jgi:hypothetical protein